jgi:hypothetical protein
MSLARYIETHEKKKKYDYVSRDGELERGNVTLNCRCISARLHGVICYRTANFMYSAKMNLSFLEHKTFASTTIGIFIFFHQISNLFS